MILPTFVTPTIKCCICRQVHYGYGYTTPKSVFDHMLNWNNERNCKSSHILVQKRSCQFQFFSIWVQVEKENAPSYLHSRMFWSIRCIVVADGDCSSDFARDVKAICQLFWTVNKTHVYPDARSRIFTRKTSRSCVSPRIRVILHSWR